MERGKKVVTRVSKRSRRRNGKKTYKTPSSKITHVKNEKPEVVVSSRQPQQPVQRAWCRLAPPSRQHLLEFAPLFSASA